MWSRTVVEAADPGAVRAALRGPTGAGVAVAPAAGLGIRDVCDLFGCAAVSPLGWPARCGGLAMGTAGFLVGSTFGGGAAFYRLITE